jgi:hypothetical protein
MARFENRLTVKRGQLQSSEWKLEGTGGEHWLLAITGVFHSIDNKSNDG